MKSLIKSLWLSASLSFLLSVQYIERYVDEKNRMLFFWNRWDALAIAFSAFIIGAVLWGFYVILNRMNRAGVRKTIETAFIFALGIAVIKDVENWLLKSPLNDQFEGPLQCFIAGTWFILIALAGFYWMGGNRKIKDGAVQFCLVLSPLSIIFIANLTMAGTWSSTKGELFGGA